MAKKKNFWDKEYQKGKRQIGKQNPHLKLSTEPSEDLVKFARFLERQTGRSLLNVTGKVVDLGCGNGRNILHLAREYGMHGLGYDISSVAVAEAEKAKGDARVEFTVRSLTEPIPLPDASCVLALDMMASHVLKKAEREHLRDEVLRVLKPRGWLFFKSFLLDEDKHAARLLRERPGPEEHMYVHPEIGIAEYVWSEEAVRDFFEPHFTIHKLEKSHKHVRKDGSAWKRRTISCSLEKA